MAVVFWIEPLLTKAGRAALEELAGLSARPTGAARKEVVRAAMLRGRGVKSAGADGYKQLDARGNSFAVENLAHRREVRLAMPPSSEDGCGVFGDVRMDATGWDGRVHKL